MPGFKKDLLFDIINDFYKTFYLEYVSNILVHGKRSLMVNETSFL